MTNYQILIENRDKCKDIIQPEITYDNDGNLNFKIDYNFVETTSMLSFNNRMFYEKNLLIKGSVIYDIDTSEHYMIYFDPMIFYENSQVKVKIIL